MSPFFRPLAIGVAFAVLAPAAAQAADYSPPIYVDEAPEYVPVEIGSGWYLRGDIGYAFATSARGDFTYRTFDPVAGTYGQSAFATTELDGRFSYGGGFGYHFNDFLRADLTVERFNVRFDGTTTSGAPCVDPGAFPAYAGTGCRSEDTSRLTGTSVMANAYVDLGTYVGFTPYVGAGAGATYLKWDNLTSDAYCTDATCPFGAAGTTTYPGAESWRFTYAAMAGIAYEVSKNLKVDLGYRFRRVAGGEMFNWDAGTAAAGATGTQGSDSGFNQHEIRLGLRYELW